MEQPPADEMLEQCRAMMAMMHDAGTGAMPSDGMMGGMMSASGGMMLFGLLWVAVVVAIGVAIVWLLLDRRRGRMGDARRTLDLRYARGELDRDTYVRMRADLIDGPSRAG